MSDPTFCEVSIADELRRLGCKASGLGDVASGPLLPAKSSQLRESAFPPPGLRPASEKDSNSTNDLREIASLTEGGVVGGSPLLNLALASLADAGLPLSSKTKNCCSPVELVISIESTDDLPEIASLTEGGVVGGAPLLNLALASLADAEPTEDLGGVASPIDTGDPTDDLRALASTAAVGSEDNALSVELEGEGLLKSPRNGVEAVSCCR